MTIVSVRVKRPRKPSLARACKDAEKAGLKIAGAVIRSDAIELQFGEPEKAAGTETPLDKWINKHAN